MIHIFQHHDSEGPAHLAMLLEARGLDWRVLRTDRGDFPQTDDASAAIVSLGGPQSVNRFAPDPWLRREIEFIRLAVDRGTPVLGICLGAQILARACGLQVLPMERREIGWHDVQLSAAARRIPYFSELPEEFECFHWHGEQIVPGAEVEALAASELCPCQAVSPLPGLLALQFHLEITQDSILAMASAFSGELAQELIGIESLLPDPVSLLADSHALAERLIGAWLNEVATQTNKETGNHETA